MPARRDLCSRTGAGVRKPPRKEPAGAGWAVCRLWGFGGAAACVGDALAGVVGGGSTIAVGSLLWRRGGAGGLLAGGGGRPRLRGGWGHNGATADAKVPRRGGVG